MSPELRSDNIFSSFSAIADLLDTFSLPPFGRSLLCPDNSCSGVSVDVGLLDVRELLMSVLLSGFSGSLAAATLDRSSLPDIGLDDWSVLLSELVIDPVLSALAPFPELGLGSLLTNDISLESSSLSLLCLGSFVSVLADIGLESLSTLDSAVFAFSSPTFTEFGLDGVLSVAPPMSSFSEPALP